MVQIYIYLFHSHGCTPPKCQNTVMCVCVRHGDTKGSLEFFLIIIRYNRILINMTGEMAWP